MSGADVYDSSKIKVLKGLKAVRERPSACTSAIPTTALVCIIWFLRWSTTRSMKLLPGHAWKSRDHSRRRVGLSPTTIGAFRRHAPGKKGSAAEMHYDCAACRGKVRRQRRKVRRPARRRGLRRQCAVGALVLTIHRDGRCTSRTYRLGVPVAPLAVVGRDTISTGTTIRFKPSATIFTNIEFQYEICQAVARAVVPELRCAHRA